MNLRRLYALSLLVCCGCQAFLDDYAVPECGPHAILTDEGCVEVGVATCSPDDRPGAFVRSTDGGCDPVVASVCAGPSLAVLGESECVPVAACRSLDALDGDPVASQADIDSSTASNLLLVANITGTVTLTRPGVTLRGACPEEARVEHLSIVAADVTVSGLRATSITLTDAPGARLESLWIDGGAAPGSGVSCTSDAAPPATVHLERVAIDATLGPGISSSGCDVAAMDVHIRAPRPDPTHFRRGAGVEISASPATQAKPGFIGRGLVIDDASGAGVAARGAAIDLDGVAIRHTTPGPFEKVLDGRADAPGIELERFLAHARGTPRESIIRHAVIEGATGVGIRVAHGPRERDREPYDVRIVDTTVRDTRTPEGRCQGHALRSVAHPAVTTRVAMNHVTLVGSVQTAVHTLGSHVAISNALIRGVHACGPQQRFGDGVAVHSQVDGTLVRPDPSTITTTLISAVAGSGAVAMGDSDLFLGDVTIEPGEGRASLLVGAYDGLDPSLAVGVGNIELENAQCPTSTRRLTPCSVTPADNDEPPALGARDESGALLPTAHVDGDLELSPNVDNIVFFLRGQDEVLGQVPGETWRLAGLPRARPWLLAAHAPDALGTLIPWQADAQARIQLGLVSIDSPDVDRIAPRRGTLRILTRRGTGCGGGTNIPAPSDFTIDGQPHGTWLTPDNVANLLVATDITPGPRLVSLVSGAPCLFTGCEGPLGCTDSTVVSILRDEPVQLQLRCICP